MSASALMEGLWDYGIYNLYETEQILLMRILLSAKYYQLAYMSAMLASALMDGLWDRDVHSLYETVLILLRCEFVPSVKYYPLEYMSAMHAVYQMFTL